MLCLRILIRKKKIDEIEVMALVKKEVAIDVPNQAESLKFLPEAVWPAVKGLENIKMFANLISNMESEALQWRKWYAEEKAEIAELPRAFKDISLFHRLLILRAMRPDRLSGALQQFVQENLGEEFVEQTPFDVFTTYAEMTAGTPVFFVLFPGVDPTPDVERVGKANGVSIADGTLINISMGQGQEDIAIKALHNGAKQGHWIMVQNVHLM
jgi:dynein heavy chain